MNFLLSLYSFSSFYPLVSGFSYIMQELWNSRTASWRLDGGATLQSKRYFERVFEAKRWPLWRHNCL